MASISEQFSKIAAKVRRKLPVQQLQWVPGHAFFCRQVQLPDVPADEQLTFIELFLESKAPFPVEQLLWGFVRSQHSADALVYATTRQRLKQLDGEDATQALFLLPAFLCTSGTSFDAPSVAFIAANGSINAVFFAANDSVPVRVVSRPLPAAALTDTVLLQVREDLWNAIKTADFNPADGVYLLQETAVDEHSRCTTKLLHVRDADSDASIEHRLDLQGDVLWNADLRDAAFVHNERAKRRRAALLWKAVRAAAATAILLLFLQFVSAGMQFYNGLRESTIEELGNRAIRVENTFTLANRLTESTEEDIRPFALMESINPVRPESIYFTRTRSRGFNRLEIEGESEQGVNPVNTFADALNQLPYVDEVEQNVQTRNNQTSFTFAIRFNGLPPGADQPLLIPEEPEATEEAEDAPATGEEADS
jgi:hypothetical protein